MSHGKIAILGIIALFITSGVFFLFRTFVLEEKSINIELADRSVLYQAKEEIKNAIASFNSGVEPTEVITRLNASDANNEIAIIIDGLPERYITEKILAVLDKHKVEAVFFVEGQNAANEEDNVKLIVDAGHEIGNFTFVGISEAEKLTSDKLISELVRTQEIIKAIIYEKPTLFRIARTAYNENILKVGKAAELDYAVRENIRYWAGSLNTEEEVAKIASTVTAGSIIAVAVNRPVELRTDDVRIVDERPAIDKKPTVQDPERNNKVTNTLDVAEELDVLLTNLIAKGLKTSDIHAFRKIHYIPVNTTKAANQIANNTINMAHNVTKR